MLSPSGAQAIQPTIEVLLVGGGGAGDSGAYFSSFAQGICSCGGAGGEVLEAKLVAPAVGSYAVTIGVGGIPYGAGAAIHWGGITKFGDTLSAIGGGGAGGGYVQSGYESTYATSGFNSAGLSRTGWVAGRVLGGFPGGTSWTDYSSVLSGGGGGGSGGPGANATSAAPGIGGVGKFSSITGLPVEYGRGGTGGHHSIGRGPAAFGYGGGGGGGKNGEPFGTYGEPGNAGIFVLRYLTGTQVWAGGVVSYSGLYTIHTFTADGTITRVS